MDLDRFFTASTSTTDESDSDGDDETGSQGSEPPERVVIDAPTKNASGRAARSTRRSRTGSSGAGAQSAGTDTNTGSGSGGWLRSKWASLAHGFDQTIETRTKSPAIGLFRGASANTVSAAEGVDEYYDVYETTAIVFTSLWNFAADVWEPGYRVEDMGDDPPTNDDGQTPAEWLEDEWLPQAAVLFGGKRNEFLPFGKHTTIQRWARGGALLEHVRADPDEAGSLITGLNFIPPETVSFVPYQHKPILVDPDPPSALEDAIDGNLERTRRGEWPAYIQYHKDAPVSTSRDPVPLSQNDVSRTIFGGDAAGVGTDLTNFWGTPVTQIIAEDVAGFKGILRDKERAIKNKAYGLWRLAFDREVLEYSDIDPETGEQVDVTELIEWPDDEQEELVNQLENQMGPGSILTHDGEVEMDRLDGEVPDLIEDLEFYVSNITAALPTPLFIIGWETNINQFVTEQQNERYQRLIEDERNELGRFYTKIGQRVIASNPEFGIDNPHGADIEFRVEPQEEESPVLSESPEAIERMDQWTTAFERLQGDTPLAELVDHTELLKLILQLPEDAIRSGDEDGAPLLADTDDAPGVEGDEPAPDAAPAEDTATDTATEPPPGPGQGPADASGDSDRVGGEADD